MAFIDAVFKERAWLEGVEAWRVDDLRLLGELLAVRQIIPVIEGIATFMRPS